MATRVFLHVGLPKSGTTYLQAVLVDNKDRLADRSDLLFPGRNWQEQVRAVRDVRGQKGRGASADDAGAWDAMAAEITRWDGSAVVSMEWLGGALTEQAARIVSSLAPAKVEVVVTVRDLTRTIPAAWQEFLQNGETWSWSEFLGSVTSEHPRGTPAGNAFWAQQDLGKILAVWRDSVPGEQLHVVTVPPSGSPPGELWARFSQVLGIDGALFDAGGRGSNESLGRESTELMLRVNEMARSRDVDWATYEEMFKHVLAKRCLSKRRHRESPGRRLPAELAEWAVARTAEQVRAIEASGAAVVGDLADLEPVFADTAESAESDTDAVLEAAVEGIVALAKDRGVELERLRRRVDTLSRKSRQAGPTGPAESSRRRIRRLYGRGSAVLSRIRGTR